MHPPAARESDSTNYLYRAAEERSAAEQAMNARARNIHLRLAIFYESAAHANGVEETSQVLETAFQ